MFFIGSSTTNECLWVCPQTFFVTSSKPEFGFLGCVHIHIHADALAGALNIAQTAESARAFADLHYVERSLRSHSTITSACNALRLTPHIGRPSHIGNCHIDLLGLSVNQMTRRVGTTLARQVFSSESMIRFVSGKNRLRSGTPRHPI